MRVVVTLAALVLGSVALRAEVATHETTIINNQGVQIGTASFRSTAKTTVIRISLRAGALSPGWHGIHLHAVGDCSDTTAGFKASKGHVNHSGAKHGLLNPEGPEAGDLPNIFAASDGSVNAEVSSNTELGGANGLRQGDGSALVIHANADDHTSQPIGGAGDRVACGVVR